MDKNIQNIINAVSDAILVVDNDRRRIVEKNDAAVEKFPEAGVITDLEHLFSFDVGILNADDILKFTPLPAAISSKEPFWAECNFQVSQTEFKEILLRCFEINGYKILIFIDYTDSVRAKEYLKIENELASLKQQNIEVSELKQKAENAAMRTSLVNMISSSIREILDIDKIIEIVIKETATTLQSYTGYFAFLTSNKDINIVYSLNNLNHASLSLDEIEKIIKKPRVIISSVMIDGELRPRLIAPVIYNNILLGLIVFYRSNNSRLWTKEEITLVEGIASQLVIAINQSKLFEEINAKRVELENALNKLNETQTQLVQSEKMASLGQLVAGVAHEINTPLGAVSSNTSILNKCVEKLALKNLDENDKRMLGMISEANRINKEAISRINKIVKNLKNFARLDESEFKHVDIHEGLDSTIELLGHELANKISLIKEYGQLPFVKCYPDLLNQVFMNLLMNAIQSIEGKGEIRIKTYHDINSVHITISDTGKGISKEKISRIFDPGFTTKGVGVGTGLGLSIVHKIIEKHKGQIKVFSEESQGTTFEIILPMDF